MNNPDCCINPENLDCKLDPGCDPTSYCYCNIDLDNNGCTDDILPISDSGTTAVKRLENKIKDWASDADRLILYLVDHGGPNRFSLTANEILIAGELNEWLNIFQNSSEKEVIVIYDACKSGSFQPVLRPDAQKPDTVCPSEVKPRIIISSATEDQNAYFLNQGTISFSEFFWSEVFNGADSG